MGDATGQLADGFHLLRLNETLLARFQVRLVLLEVVGHRVEHLRESTDFVGSTDLDPLGEVAAAELAGRLLQANDRVDDRA